MVTFQTCTLKVIVNLWTNPHK